MPLAISAVHADPAHAYQPGQVLKEETQSFVFPCCTVVWASSMHQSLNSLSTVRARFGYAFDNVLIYGTGGLAVGQVEYEFKLNFPDVGGPGLLGAAGDEKSKLAVGYTGGAGIEVGFGPWSLKTEYLFYNLGDETLNAPFTIAGAPQPFAFRPHFVTEGQVVRVDTNFRLNYALQRPAVGRRCKPGPTPAAP